MHSRQVWRADAATLHRPTTSVGDVHGVAEFVLSATKTGVMKLIATGDVDLREDQIVQATTTNRLNVK